MNNSLKKLLALALALVCLLSVAACGKNDTTTAGDTTNGDTTTTAPQDPVDQTNPSDPTDSTNPTDPEPSDPTDPTKPVVKLTLVYNDVTLDSNSRTVNLYDGTMDPAEITWTSSDETIATVAKGVVTALKDGKVTITATFGEQTATCTVRVNGLDADQKAEYALHGGWSYTNDVTLKLGETFTLSLRNKNTNEIVKNLTWNVSGDFAKCCTMEVTEDGVKITSTAITANLSGGIVKIWTEYEGVKYECKIRVSAATAQE